MINQRPMPSLKLPQKIVVQDYLRDSSIWDSITPRTNDILIASCYKSGTTLTQQIVNLLVHGDDEFDNLHNLSPWVEHRHDLLNEKIEQIKWWFHGKLECAGDGAASEIP